MSATLHNVGRGLVLAASSFGLSSAWAAEVYYQPLVTLSAETNSNLDLDTTPHSQKQGYLADLATVVAYDTPTWTSIARPRLVYRYYPQARGDNRLEGYLDFNTNYRSQRSTASFLGSVQHLDLFNAEFTSAVFNDINPTQPAPDTGRTVVGSTRDSAFLQPKYVYSFTPNWGGGVSAQYQVVHYSPAGDSSHLNFDYYQARAFASWTATQRTELSFGGFGSKFATKSVFSEAKGSGAFVDLSSNWTPLITTTAELNYQHTSIDTSIPTPLSSQVNKLGGSFDASYKTQSARFVFDARRSISPSGGGAVYTTDRVQFEYDRTLTARLSMTAAVLDVRTHGLTANLAGDDRQYAQTVIEGRWMMTARWLLLGGYQYAWQKYQNSPDSAANNRIYIQVGYQGLGQQR